MKNLSSFFVLFLALFFFPVSLPAALCNPDCESETNWTLEVRGAYYRPSSKKLKQMYSQCLIDYQITFAKRVHNYCEVWGEFDWVKKKGTARHDDLYDVSRFKDRSRISIIPVSLGLKLIYPIFRCVDVYLGAGVSYSFLRIKNHSKDEYSYAFSDLPFKKLIHKQGVGGLFKAGLQFAMSDSTYLDFFADYYLQKFHFSHREDRQGRSLFKHHLDCSGFKFGAGFGVYF